jgi:hypothetical protein
MPTPLWSYRLSAASGGIALARESGQTLAWDIQQRLVLLSRRGSVQAQSRRKAPLLAAVVSDDGSAAAVIEEQSVAWLRRDLSPRWCKPTVNKPTALALDSHGRCLAVADSGNRLQLYEKGGRLIGASLSTPRPLYHLHFLAAEPYLVGAADFGLLLALDLRSRQWVWQDSPVIHLGDLAASGRGGTIALGCFSEGVRRYDLAGKQRSPLATPEPCRYAAITYDGRRLLVGTIFGLVCALDDDGGQRFEQRFDQTLVGLGMTALGDAGVIVLADGRVVGLDFSEELKSFLPILPTSGERPLN